MRRQHVASLPFLGGVPVLFLVLLWVRDGGFRPMPFVLGVVGWAFALALRGPVAMLAKQREWPVGRVKVAVVATSGPAEELVRLGLVLLSTRAFSEAFSLGLGWAAIEVVYTVVNGFVLLAVLSKGDEEARKAQAALEQMGASVDEALGSWTKRVAGVLERLSASAFHIGATLLVAHRPLLVLVTIPVHSGLNLTTLVPAIRSRLWLIETVVALAGGGALVAGLVVWRA